MADRTTQCVGPMSGNEVVMSRCMSFWQNTKRPPRREVVNRRAGGWRAYEIAMLDQVATQLGTGMPAALHDAFGVPARLSGLATRGLMVVIGQAARRRTRHPAFIYRSTPTYQ